MLASCARRLLAACSVWWWWISLVPFFFFGVLAFAFLAAITLNSGS